MKTDDPQPRGTDPGELEYLRRRVAEYEDIIRCLPVGLIFVDDQDRVAIANPMGSEIRCVGDRLGGSVADCHPAGTHTTLEKVMQRFRDEPQLQEHPIVLERLHRYEITYSRVAKPDGAYRGVLWMASDISRRKKLERELLHAERLAGLGRMAARVAHDIKNPLNAIQGAAHFLQTASTESGQKTELTDLIKEQVARIANLVTRLNELTKPFQLKLEPTDIRTVMNDVLGSCSVSHPSARWTLNVEEAVPEMVPCDRGLLERLICNATENACLAMGGEGCLEITINIRIEEDGSWVEFTFQDEGSGFPDQILENRFQPFLTTRPTGTGLGLTIMREICLLHGGELEIDNNERGAVVTARISSR